MRTLVPCAWRLRNMENARMVNWLKNILSYHALFNNIPMFFSVSRNTQKLLTFIHLVVVVFLVVVMTHPEVLDEIDQETEFSVETERVYDEDSSTDKVTVFKFEPYTWIKNRTMKKEQLCIVMTLSVCAMLISFFLVLGTIKHRPGYLMPFFCLQVFDFCLNCLTAVGYFSYAPNIKMWLTQTGLANLPLIKRLMCLDEEWLILIIALGFITYLAIKAYLMGIVWSCYKYIQLRNASRATIREYNVDPDSEMLLPPKYEDAIKLPQEQPPPPYTSE